ncbi:MAG: hypothetical protein ABJA76_02920 [Mucilaginibacter sp.]
MKKTLSLLLLLIPLFCISQTKKPIDGFFGIKFGADSATVKAIVLAKGGVIGERSKPGHMVFSKINYETWKNVTLYVEILENKTYKIAIAIIKMAPDNVLQDYKKLVNETNAIYGAGREISSENVSSSTLWMDKNINNINVSTLSSEVLMLTYKNNDLGPMGEKIR